MAALRREVRALGLAARHPRTPWYARALCFAVVAYALSPIDLVPDFVPVLGHLDDLLLVPLGLWLALRLVPADVLAECRVRAAASDARLSTGGSRVAAAVILVAWVVVAIGALLLALAQWSSGSR